MNLLFVCSQNNLRSPTAESVFSDIANISVRSAALNNHAEIPLGVEDVIWADYIFVMEQSQKKKLRSHFKIHLNAQRVICLGIPDNYEYMEPALVDLFKQKVAQYVDV
ncbi:low molecular weight protein tyrosine phosphatase family protein [Psychrosphaera algicola]|uniref:Phosphotyrosine protein phosphatase n=1 Tax=Psychrosphaera algicola TaxID=3023714 RepID=A0ABT5FEA4_9GAMM|nr:phosphotyrosine protein phosphatase [Psychrosphaera sp. G1-22]MDC2888952.1 phosphotyrosine protein phosphatase [Psychrosphaera sp. G1-22]